MRTLSPSIDPPRTALVGSMLSTANVDVLRSSRAIPSWSMSELLPAPGAPVTPMRHASPPELGTRPLAAARSTSPTRAASSGASTRQAQAAVPSPLRRDP